MALRSSGVVIAWDSFGLIGWFNLDCGMEDTVLILFTDLIYILDSFVSPVWSNMAGHNVLSSGEGPAVEVVNFLNCFKFLNIVIQVLHLDVWRGSLHYYSDAVEENWHGRHQDENWEQEGANWVGFLPLRVWLELKDQCGGNYSNALNHVT